MESQLDRLARRERLPQLIDGVEIAGARADRMKRTAELHLRDRLVRVGDVNLRNRLRSLTARLRLRLSLKQTKFVNFRVGVTLSTRKAPPLSTSRPRSNDV